MKDLGSLLGPSLTKHGGPFYSASITASKHTRTTSQGPGAPGGQWLPMGKELAHQPKAMGKAESSGTPRLRGSALPLRWRTHSPIIPGATGNVSTKMGVMPAAASEPLDARWVQWAQPLFLPQIEQMQKNVICSFICTHISYLCPRREPRIVSTLSTLILVSKYQPLQKRIRGF